MISSGCLFIPFSNNLIGEEGWEAHTASDRGRREECSAGLLAGDAGHERALFITLAIQLHVMDVWEHTAALRDDENMVWVVLWAAECKMTDQELQSIWRWRLTSFPPGTVGKRGARLGICGSRRMDPCEQDASSSSVTA